MLESNSCFVLVGVAGVGSENWSTVAVSTLPLRIILKTGSLILPLGEPEDSVSCRQASKVYLCCPAPSKQIYQPEAQVLCSTLEQGRDCSTFQC